MNKLFLALLFFMPPTFSSTMGASKRAHKRVKIKLTEKELNQDFAKQEKVLNDYLKAMQYKANLRNRLGLEKGKIQTIVIDLYYV